MIYYCSYIYFFKIHKNKIEFVDTKLVDDLTTYKVYY